MTADDFEWDDTKAAANLRKHGLPFDIACLVFRDPFAIEFEDQRFDYGEIRFVTIGQIEGRLITVAHTVSDRRIRIISARGATPFERRIYHEQGN